MPTPESALDEMRAEQHAAGVSALLAVGPALLTVAAWWAIRKQHRALAALEAAGPVIDVDSQPAEAPAPPEDG